jgi:hypothetical protein
MRITTGCSVLLVALALASESCNGDALGPETALTIATPADLSASVAKATLESGVGPEGPYSQYDVWLVVTPGGAPDAGVVMPVNAPVFVQRSGRTYAANASDIAAGDHVDVWTVPRRVAYGVVQGPPGAPTYTGMQLVIYR